MKKVSLFVFVLLTGYFLISSQSQFTAFSASNNGKSNAPQPDSNVANQDIETDRKLATVIRQLTDRSTEGLVEKRTPDGGVSMDLDERFQNVMLSRIDTDGEAVAACITSLDEANAFLGKNLETGAPIYSNLFQKDNTEAAAARHGMSGQEFEFYKKLIEDAAIRRASSPNAATLNIINNDGAGEGFNDATAVSPEGGNSGTTLGQQRLNLFQFAASIWGAYLDTNVPIDVKAQFNPLSCSNNSGVLGSAGTTNIFRDFPNAQFPNTWYSVALANKRAGDDLLPTGAEINATFNSTVNNSAGCLGGERFYYGFDNSTPPGTVNLLVVLLHEMGHGLGFQSFANGSTGALAGGFPDVYTRNMFDRSTGKYWYEMTDAERQTSALNSNNVLWDGPNVKMASGSLTAGRDTANGRVMLFTPSTFQQGSSVSHWSTAASPNLLMEPNINFGLPINLDLTRQQMRDVGWYSDSSAAVIPDTITDIQPSGNTIIPGNTSTITWTNTGGFNRNVTVELSIDGGATYSTLASNIANTGSYTFTVPNTITTQGRVRVREYNFVEPMGISAANFAISTTVAAPNHTAFDFDGDGKADISVFRPSNGIWYLNQSANGFTGLQFGAVSDKLVPADYDGDGKTDVAVFRNDTWFIQRSSLGFTNPQFGQSDDLPVPADFDGDGKTDIAVYRPSTGTWFLQQSTLGFTGIQFGESGDKPVAADFDGDGKADLAVFRPSNGIWYIQQSTAGFTGIQFGAADDKLVAADYDGDGKADVAVFRPSNGFWYLQRSQLGFTGIQFGIPTDFAAPADYDGDGKADLAVFRAGTWFLQRSTAGFTGIAFGAIGDQPVPNAFVP